MKRSVAIRRLATLMGIRTVTFAAAMSMSLLATSTQPQAATADRPDGVRMMLKVQIPPDGGNQAIKAGNQGAIFQALIDQIKPEAVYFTQEDGLRTAYFVYTIHETTDFAAIHEPLIQGFGARVYDMPALTWDELKNAFGAIGEKP
jgi:hypothetical protein